MANMVKSKKKGGNHMAFNDAVIDELIKGHTTQEDFFGKNGLIKQLTKRILERALQGELTAHVGYEKHAPEGRNGGNSRNGSYTKRVLTDDERLTIEVPRDRDASFEPVILPKGQTRFDGFDDKIISLYARGLTVREIQGHLQEIYQVEVSPDLISNVTEAVMAEIREWQDRPLDAVYPIVYVDALMVKVRDQGHVINKAAYLALGVNLAGLKELLGIWIEETEGAKFWLKVCGELQARGVRDIFVACVDGLKGLPEAIESLFPKTRVQLCLVHLVRNALRFVSYKDRRAVVADLKAVYQAASAEAALAALDDFAHKWDGKYPLISKSWRTNWDRLSPFFAYPPDIRRVIYTTNAIESLNASLRKIINHRRAFPNDDAVLKILYLALRNASKKWTMPIKDWPSALNQFSIICEGRVPVN
jgi:putative transposase